MNEQADGRTNKERIDRLKTICKSGLVEHKNYKKINAKKLNQKQDKLEKMEAGWRFGLVVTRWLRST